MVAEKVQELEDENAILKAQVEELQELCGRGLDSLRTAGTAATSSSAT